MKRLQGKVAVVTGGNSGIGLASAQRLKEEGAKVAITGRSQKTLDEAVKLLGSDILAIQSDVSKSGEIEKVYEAVSKKFGKIDILFANAGVAKFLPVAAVTEAHYDEQFDINSKGAYFTIQKALPYLNDGARSLPAQSKRRSLDAPAFPRKTWTVLPRLFSARCR